MSSTTSDITTYTNAMNNLVTKTDKKAIKTGPKSIFKATDNDNNKYDSEQNKSLAINKNDGRLIEWRLRKKLRKPPLGWVSSLDTPSTLQKALSLYTKGGSKKYSTKRRKIIRRKTIKRRKSIRRRN